jgi:transcription antitermination protein NusB
LGIRSRRKAREVALRALYEVEIGHASLPTVLKETLSEADLSPDLDAFARQLIEGVRENLAAIDDMLAARITEWDYDRVAAVDRNVLRIATYELFHCPEIPPAVTINEAVDIGKKYSTADSGKFVNGVLARVLLDSPKAVWTPPIDLEPEEMDEHVEEAMIEEETVTEEEAASLTKIGGWHIRSEPE